MFLLERPGGDYGNGSPIQYKGFNKQPPVNHYYWTPEIEKWGENPYELSHFYGPYFAYLMNKYGLSNVYITNLIKCTTKEMFDYDKAFQTCVNNWLLKEVDIFKPRAIFCFGRKVENKFRKINKEYGLNIPFIYLSHPAARKSKIDFIDGNDIIIDKFLNSL